MGFDFGKGTSVQANSTEVTMMNISPQVAEEILKMNTHNRKMNINTAKAYAHDMQNGNWEFGNPEPITIRRSDGVLLNGQHRLQAVILSGKTIPFFVATVGDDITMFDAHKARTQTDYETLNGIGNGKDMLIKNSIVRLHLTLHKPQGYKCTPKEIADYLVNNEEYLGLAISLCRKKMSTVTRNAWVGHAVYCALKCGVPYSEMELFSNILSCGMPNGEARDCTVFVLRNWLMSTVNNPSQGGRKELTGIVENYIRLFTTNTINRKISKKVNYFYSDRLYESENAKPWD